MAKTKSLKKALKDRKKKQLLAMEHAKGEALSETPKSKKSKDKSNKKSAKPKNKLKKQKQALVLEAIKTSKKSKKTDVKAGKKAKKTKAAKPAKPVETISLPLEVMPLAKPIGSRFANTDATGLRNTIARSSSTRLALSGEEKSPPAANEPLNESQVHTLSAISRKHLSIASTLLSLAFGISVLMGLVMAFLPMGKDAIAAIAGLMQAEVPLQTGQIAFLLDTLFPIAYGAGFAFLANAFQSRGNRPVIRLLLTGLLVVVVADFAENALVFKSFTDGNATPVQWVLTVIKYATLAVAAVLMSAIIIQTSILGRITGVFLRYVFPLSIALLLSGIGGRVMADIIGATFPLGLLLLAIYALSQRFVSK